MSHRIRPTAREAKVKYYSTAGNADLSKNPSPVGLLGASFGESGSGRSGNRYVARLGITSGNVDLIQNGLRELEESGARSGNGKWNSKPLAGGEILPGAAGENSGKVQKSEIGSLDSGYADYGFSAEVQEASGSQTTQNCPKNHSKDIKHNKHKHSSKHNN